MIYTRKINDREASLDYDGTSENLRSEILLAIKIMTENKDLEDDDLAVMVLAIFKKLEEESKIAMIDLLINDMKGGKLWQELEALNKKEKK